MSSTDKLNTVITDINDSIARIPCVWDADYKLSRKKQKLRIVVSIHPDYHDVSIPTAKISVEGTCETFRFVLESLLGFKVSFEVVFIFPEALS